MSSLGVDFGKWLVKKSKEGWLMTCENAMKFNFQCLHKKIYWHITSLICLHIIGGSFCATVADSSSCNRHCRDLKAKNIYYLAPSRISLLTPALVGQGEKGTDVSFPITVRVKLSTFLSFKTFQ